MPGATPPGTCEDGGMLQVRIDVLGTLRVLVDGAPIAVDGARRRRLLHALVLRRGTPCRSIWLADVLWDGAPRASSAATLQSHVAHLRRLLEPSRTMHEPWRVIRTVPDGYALAVEQVSTDLDDLVTAVHGARPDDDVERALAALDHVLSTCRGNAFGDDAAVPDFMAEAARIDEMVIVARERRADLLMRLGRDDEVVDAARALVDEHPLREDNWSRLALGLARVGRQTDALRCLADLRHTLRDEVGLDPSESIRDLEARLVRQDLPARPVSTSVAAPPPIATMPRTVYAPSDHGVHIAYQRLGAGPALVAAPPLAQNIEICWQDHHHRRLIERAAARCTFVHFDKRGTGMSDRVVDLSLERRLRDFEAVLDHAGIERAVLAGVSEAGPLAIAFAVSRPDRVAGLALVNTFARVLHADDFPIGTPVDVYERITRTWEEDWGREGGRVVEHFAPSLRDDDSYRAWLAHYMRQSCSPGTLRLIDEANGRIDVRHLLPLVRVPTLVVHREGDRVVDVAKGRHLAENIEGAELLVVPGDDHLPWVGDSWQQILDAVLDFVARVSGGSSG
jgi:DNA-binding SARP family transcriptional activator/pimeloyl-ACP methyl ester carboxylesterase